MYRGQRVCVVIPCYNVAPHIAGVISAMPEYVDQIVAVDDGSRDDTLKALESAKDKRVEVVRHYRRIQGVRVAVAIESVASVLIAGRSTFKMTYNYETINGQSVGSPQP